MRAGLPSVDDPRTLPAPPGGDEVVEVTDALTAEVWVRRSDYVVKVHIDFYYPDANTPTVAPDMATKAVTKLAARTREAPGARAGVRPAAGRDARRGLHDGRAR